MQKFALKVPRKEDVYIKENVVLNRCTKFCLSGCAPCEGLFAADD